MMIIAQFREFIGPAIPQILALLSDVNENVRRGSVDALTKLSGQGKIYNFLIFPC